MELVWIEEWRMLALVLGRDGEWINVRPLLSTDAERELDHSPTSVKPEQITCTWRGVTGAVSG